MELDWARPPCRLGTVLGRDMLWRKLVDVVDCPFATDTEGPRAWLEGLRLYVDGLGVV